MCRISLIETHLSCGFERTHVIIERLTLLMNGRRPQFRDQPQNIGEQISGNGDLGHLEGVIASVADGLCVDLDQLSGSSATSLDGFRRRQRAQEVAEIVGQDMKLEPHRVGGERAA
jgi:hypothetical protein